MTPRSSTRIKRASSMCRTYSRSSRRASDVPLPPGPMSSGAPFGLSEQTAMTADGGHGQMTATQQKNRWAALIVLTIGVLMIVLDATIVNVALPDIQRDLGFSQAGLA